MCDNKPGNRCSTHAAQAHQDARDAYDGNVAVDPLSPATAKAFADPLVLAEDELRDACRAADEAVRRHAGAQELSERLGEQLDTTIRVLEDAEAAARVALQRARLDHLDTGSALLSEAERLYQESGLGPGDAATLRAAVHDAHRVEGDPMESLRAVPTLRVPAPIEHCAVVEAAAAAAERDERYTRAVATFEVTLARVAAASKAHDDAKAALDEPDAIPIGREYYIASEQAYRLGEEARAATVRVIGAQAALERLKESA